MINNLKKYKLWWLITASLSCFIIFNWVMYGLFGLSLISTKNFDQGVVQCVLGIVSTFTAIMVYDSGNHLNFDDLL